MIFEFSAGGVVYKKIEDTYKIVLCLQQKLSGSKVYCLPKGHIEKNEDPKLAALREVEEEAGITAKIIKPLSQISFFFTQNNNKIKKTVYFYLMECIDEHFTPNLECEKIIWCNEHESLELDPYSTEKKVIKEAFQFLKNSGQEKTVEPQHHREVQSR
ncbi:MAG: NUDIX domain-containing protein [Proteobacteria bacterium]|nr:NUDIX domain-containing protein [Pseudomonadota bacterium]